MAVPAANKASMASIALRMILFPLRRSPYRLANKVIQRHCTTVLELGTSRYQTILWTHHKPENRRFRARLIFCRSKCTPRRLSRRAGLPAMKIPPSLIPIFYSGSWLPCCIEASFCAHSVAINKKRLPTEGPWSMCDSRRFFTPKRRDWFDDFNTNRPPSRHARASGRTGVFQFSLRAGAAASAWLRPVSN